MDTCQKVRVSDSGGRRQSPLSYPRTLADLEATLLAEHEPGPSVYQHHTALWNHSASERRQFCFEQYARAPDDKLPWKSSTHALKMAPRKKLKGAGPNARAG